jgi:hypothetical protein
LGGNGRNDLLNETRDVTALPHKDVQTVWFSQENPKGEKGTGGKANHGRKGRPSTSLAAGESILLARLPETVSGTVRRIWLTIDDRSPKMLRGMILEAWWDQADEPAIRAPLGEFFGQMCGQMVKFESVFFSAPEARSFCCILPMPFRTGMRLRLTNTTDTDLALLFYDVNVTIGEEHGEGTGYIHAIARRENPTTLRQDYELLPRVTGRGRFLGVHIGVAVDTRQYGKTWWGEGEVKFYVDGDIEYPTLCGTGTEDYIGTGWGQGSYYEPFQGSPLADGEASRYGFYRWHVPDPVYFHESLRVTIQQIGHTMNAERNRLREYAAENNIPIYAAGPEELTPADLSDKPEGTLFERQDDWSSVAFYLLDRP